MAKVRWSLGRGLESGMVNMIVLVIVLRVLVGAKLCWKLPRHRY